MQPLYRRWFVISVFMLIIGARHAGAADSLVHQITLPSGMTWCDSTAIQDLLTQVNKYRLENGRSALRMDSLGMKDAELRATQFAAYMISNPPGSPGFNPHQGWDTTAASIGYNVVSENLAYMTSDPVYIVYSVWQDSLHKAAMLSSTANVAGVSCVYSNGIPYWTYEPGISTATPPGTDESSAFLTLINQYRAQNGINPLQISPTLQNAAAWMSNDMATKNYASHTDSLGRNVGTRLAAFGYTAVPYGENIAGGFGDAQNAFVQWRDACDPDAGGNCTHAHRKNMLNSGFAAIGIGRAYSASSAYGWYWVTDFGGYVDSGPAAPPSTAPVISSFIANPSSITSGQSTTLSWNISGATSISIDNGIGDVTAATSRAVSPTATTTYRLTAKNSSGTATAVASVTVAAAPGPDAQAPTVPVLTSATAKAPTRVDLAWKASTDNVGVTGYQILRNGSPAGSVAGSVLTFTDSVAANTTYTYTVRAFDAARNYSPGSNSIQVTTPVAAGGTCPAPAVNAFTGCYYNNTDLSGSPALTRTDSRIDFDWTYTPRPTALSGSAFSVRWQGNFTLAAGTYKFTLLASDGIRLYIDGSLAFDRWIDQPPVYFYTVRKALGSGTHLIAVEYYQRTGSPTAQVSWVNESPSASAPVISSFTATPASISPGQSVMLAWSVSGASSVSIDNGIGGVSASASRSVSPLTTTTYRLTASNLAGSTTAAVTVSVNAGGTDTQPPTTPVITSATAVSATRIDLKWTASTDNVGVSGYRILRNGVTVTSSPASAVSYSDSGVVPASAYKYVIQAFDAAKNFSSVSNTVSVTTPAGTVVSGCTPAMNAFTGCYYANTGLAGSPALVRVDNRIDFDWLYSGADKSLPTKDYSVRWQGNFTFDDAYYTFSAIVSDGIRIYVDDTLILDRWRDQPEYIYTVRRPLTAGVHLVTVEYYEHTGTAIARVSWQKN